MQLHDLLEEAGLERLGEARRVPPAVRKDDLGDYQFATLQGHHRFCRNCGVTAFGDGDVKELGGAFVSISVAAIDDLTPEELERLPIRTMDGRHNNWMEPPRHGSYL